MRRSGAAKPGLEGDKFCFAAIWFHRFPFRKLTRLRRPVRVEGRQASSCGKKAIVKFDKQECGVLERAGLPLETTTKLPISKLVVIGAYDDETLWLKNDLKIVCALPSDEIIVAINDND
jgi:hypothetical protein